MITLLLASASLAATPETASTTTVAPSASRVGFAVSTGAFVTANGVQASNDTLAMNVSITPWLAAELGINTGFAGGYVPHPYPGATLGLRFGGATGFFGGVRAGYVAMTPALAGSVGWAAPVMPRLAVGPELQVGVRGWLDPRADDLATYAVLGVRLEWRRH